MKIVGGGFLIIGVAIVLTLLYFFTWGGDTEPYTLVVENIQTKEVFLKIEDVVEHRFDSFNRNLMFRCKGENYHDATHIDLPKNMMLRIKKVHQKKEWE